MENTYKNFELSKRDRTENRKSPKEPETEDDVYVNTLQQFSEPKARPVSTSFDCKIITSALTVLMLGALTSLCAAGILYHNKVLSTEILIEKYENATATLMVLEYKAEETAQLYEMLKVKYQQVHDRLSACSENQKCALCEEGWKSLGLKCFYFSTEKLNWTQSRDHCVEKGGHLVIITSQTEQSSVSSKMEESHWIGLNDLETEGKWMWVNNQPLKETDVKFWYISPEGISEPDNWTKEEPSGENCAALGHEDGYFHKWFDASCSKLKLFICEK